MITDITLCIQQHQYKGINYEKEKVSYKSSLEDHGRQDIKISNLIIKE